MSWSPRAISTLVAVAMGLGFLGYNGFQAWQQRIGEEESNASKRRAEVAQILTHAAAKHADVDWDIRLANGKERVSRALMTAELQQVWLTKRPVLFVGRLLDIRREADGYYWVRIERERMLKTRPRFVGNDIVLEVACTAPMAEIILSRVREKTSTYPELRIAVVADVEEVRIDMVDDKEGKDSTLRGVGRCVSVMVLDERNRSW